MCAKVSSKRKQATTVQSPRRTPRKISEAQNQSKVSSVRKRSNRTSGIGSLGDSPQSLAHENSSFSEESEDSGPDDFLNLRKFCQYCDFREKNIKFINKSH